MRKVLCLFWISVLSLFLVACGGSGESSSSGGDLGSPSALSSDQSEVLGVLNHLRSHAGLPTVVPYTKLMDAANTHSNYLSLNLDNFGHGEIPGRPGFTGVTPIDRAKALGIDSHVGEAAVGLAFGYTATQKIWELISAPYHGLVLVMAPYRKIGIANRPDNTVLEIADFYLHDSSLMVHPCNGVVVPRDSSRGEIPDPLIQFGLSLNTNPTGTPIYISSGSLIKTVNISLIQDGKGSAEDFYPTLTSFNDKNIGSPHLAMGMPISPLTSGSSYSLVVNVTHTDGSLATKSCKFKTF